MWWTWSFTISICVIIIILIISHDFYMKDIEEAFWNLSSSPPAIFLVNVSGPLGFVLCPFHLHPYPGSFIFPKVSYSSFVPSTFSYKPYIQMMTNRAAHSNINACISVSTLMTTSSVSLALTHHLSKPFWSFEVNRAILHSD